MKKLTSVLLCAVMIFSLFSVCAFAQDTACDCGNTPTIVIPGLMQSQTYLYNDDGTINEDYSSPFFMEDTDTIVKQALSKVLFPLLTTIITQSDPDAKLAQGFADVLCNVLGEKIRSDANGNGVYNVDAVHYNKSFADCTPEQQAHILSAIPISDYIDIAGGDHLYYFSFNSFGNLDKITEELYNLINTVKQETGHSKVNIVPISQGGTIANNLLEKYSDVTDSIDRLIYVVAALDGTSIVSDMYINGILDDPEAIYGYMIPELMGDDMTSKLVRIALRLLPEKVLQDMLDRAVDTLVNDYLVNTTTMWAFIKSDDYEAAADKYLQGEEHAEIRRQADSYQQARLNSDKNILLAKEKGVEVFNIVNYNHALYPIVDSWDNKNADGIIDLDSTSMGAHAAPVGEALPEGYTQQGNAFGTCSDPTHNHIDSHNILDASTGLLPDHTFYFYNADHERTGSNDVLVGLIVKLLYDKSFTDVYSYPDMYPQFNEARNGRHMQIISSSAKYFLYDKSEEEYPELRAAVSEVDSLLGETIVDYEENLAASDNLDRLLDEARGDTPEEPGFFDKILEKLVDGIYASVEKNTGYHSFSGK